MRRVLLVLMMACLPMLAAANDKQVALHAPEALVQSGLLKHILPRFSLKTQVRVTLVTEDQADMVFGPEKGRALFEGVGAVWHMDLRSPDHPGTQRFAKWLTSDVGRNTIQGFAPEGTALFGPPPAREAKVAAVELDGDAVLGKTVSHVKCGRCHVTSEENRMNGIGSTPSFFVLRTFDDWDLRFSGFYALKPHGAFTQIEDVTDPFPEDRPSPIAPIDLTLDELEAVIAYVRSLAAADLGKPIEHQ